jgi:MFS family permease
MTQGSGADGAARRWLTPNVKVLSAVSFLQDAASELLYPLLPIYLTVTLGAPPAVVGAVEGAAEGAASLTKIAAGALSDRLPRRPLVAGGYGLAALGKVMVAAATAWSGVLAGRVTDRLGKGIRGAPRDALLVEGIDPAARGRVFGFHRAMDTLGAVLGPLIGLAGYQLLDHEIRPLLWIAVVPAVLSAALVVLVRDQRARPARSAARRRVFAGARDLPPGYWRVIAVLVAFAVLNFPDALVLLRLNEIGFSVPGVILAYVGYNAVYAIGSYPAGVLADKVPRPLVFAGGLGFFATAYLGLALTTNHTAAWLVIAVYGLFAAATDGVGKAWISGMAPDALQGTAQGVFQGLSGLSTAIAGLWAGLLWGHDGGLPLLLSGSGAAVLAIALIALTGYGTGRLNPDSS